MKSARHIAVVLVTAPDLRVARKIAKAVVKARMAACVNIVPRIESHYWWNEKLESGAEVLMIIKTTRAKLAALESCVIANHPYDTPEVIVLRLESGNQRYLAWLRASLRSVCVNVIRDRRDA